MTQTNLTQSTELLAQFQLWAALEPDRCRVDTYNDTPRLKAQTDVALKLGDGWITVWATGIGIIGASGLAILQAALQEAIEQSDFGCATLEFSKLRAKDRAWIADILPWRPGLEPKYGGFHAHPAIALLTAYLKALQAARTAV